jgi:hypothetical protein
MPTSAKREGCDKFCRKHRTEHTQDDRTAGEEHPAMDTASRGWTLTRDAWEGGKTTCIHSRCQTVIENDVIARKDLKFHGYEDFTGRGKGSTSTEDGAAGLVGAPTRKDREGGL